MTPTGTSMSKISCSRLANVNADRESPPRSVKCASGCRSVADALNSAPAARLMVCSTGRSAQNARRRPAVVLHVGPSRTMQAQPPQLIGLAIGQLDVELFEPLAVVL